MQQVNVGVVGLGNVGMGALTILADNAEQIALKLGFRLKVTAVCSRSVESKTLPAALGQVFKTNNWREVVSRPDVDVVAELVHLRRAAPVDGRIRHKVKPPGVLAPLPEAAQMAPPVRDVRLDP